MTLRQEGAAGGLFFQKKLLSYETDGVETLKFVSSARQNQRVGWLTVVLVAIEASPVGSKPPAAVGERIFKGGNRTWAPQRRSRPKCHPYMKEREVRLSRRNRSRSSVHLEPFVQYNYPRASLKLLWRSLVSAGPSSSMGRRGCRASCSSLATRWFILLKSSLISFKVSPISDITRQNSSLYASWGVGPLPSDTASFFFRGMIG